MDVYFAHTTSPSFKGGCIDTDPKFLGGEPFDVLGGGIFNSLNERAFESMAVRKMKESFFDEYGIGFDHAISNENWFQIALDYQAEYDSSRQTLPRNLSEGPTVDIRRAPMPYGFNKG